ncbi:unnamed protein product [Eruca vesicaria subsp. sativa]|uniref:Uncharacterized protein n=1 Tax=Eruca vesicaria subsp. sativa TaxID=29727 RepID=A0ABC8KGS0_ERUVS|nr:unnamed protein product [Eruca vesicaria subsp. sativa]
MSGVTLVKLGIHFGGTMEKIDYSYKYIGEIGEETVRWELYDISWDKFLKFSKEAALINATIRFIWYREMEKEMKTVNYEKRKVRSRSSLNMIFQMKQSLMSTWLHQIVNV